MDVTIIGAGPVGSYLAYLLVSQGVSVDLYEEHKEIGQPVQCTGILTKDIDLIRPIKSTLRKSTINTVDKAYLIAPNDSSANLSLKTNYIIDRQIFDKGIADKAKAAGARLHLGYRLVSVQDSMLRFSHNGKFVKKRYGILVGADGPGSIVNKGIIKNKIRYWVGAQVRTRMKNDCSVKFYIYPKGYAWVVPESRNIVRAGVVAETRVNQKLKSFLGSIGCSSVIDFQGGLIPRFDPNIKTTKGKVHLVGDAATQVKATTGGGIVPGLMAAEELCKAIIDSGNYNKLWKKRIGKGLWLHLQIRKILDNMEPKDYNKLVRMLSRKKVKSILEKTDRENPVKYLWKLALVEPRFMAYLRFLRN